MIARVRAIVVSWNSAATLDRCLEALVSTRWPAGQLEVVVVDNGSTDGSTADWERRHPGIELRETGANLGFGAAANRALGDLDGIDAVALVNPDAFVDPGWLTPLVEALEHEASVGAASPKILLERRTAAGEAIINNVGNELGRRWEPHDRGLGEVDEGQYDRPEDVWGWCGGGVLLRTDYLRSVGTFDERLFLYCEDSDLSWRGRKQGWRYRYVPTSVIWHVHRGSSGGERTPLLDYLNRRNRLVVVSRHGGWRGTCSAWGRALGGIVVAAVRQLPVIAARRRIDDGLRRRIRAAVDAARMLCGRTVALPLDHARRDPTDGMAA